MLKIGDQHQVNINELDYKGDGITKIANTYFYVQGVLKGEEVIVEITNLKGKYGNAKVVKIIKESNNRVNKTSLLGSLNLYHLAFSEQLNWQKRITKETLERALQIDILVNETVTDNREFNYRNKVVFHVLKGNVLKLGLFSNNNQSLEVVNNFILASKQVNEILTILNSARIAIDNNVLSNIVFKNNRRGQILVTIVSNTKDFKGLKDLVNVLKAFKNVIGLTINLKKYQEKILSNESILVYGINLLEDNNLLINDQSFMQVNFGVMDLTYNLIKENIKGSKIIDAYSGVGSIGFSVYSNDKQITMIENNSANVSLANKIKSDNSYHNIDIVLANAEDVIKDYSADTIIIDPPRKGLKESLINEIINNDIERIIYLSCDLQTLTRDLRVFSNNYDIDKVYPIKMFPQTNAFETLVILNRKMLD